MNDFSFTKENRFDFSSDFLCVKYSSFELTSELDGNECSGDNYKVNAIQFLVFPKDNGTYNEYHFENQTE
ncbi:MAG: hypothetical protein V7K32_28135 [Nostoc sp.]|uniref:hypothetical protein n=1 Tax=Nostoc sp. TaxID=1180 RepID=UPI002FFD0017